MSAQPIFPLSCGRYFEASLGAPGWETHPFVEFTARKRRDELGARLRQAFLASTAIRSLLSIRLSAVARPQPTTSTIIICYAAPVRSIRSLPASTVVLSTTAIQRKVFDQELLLPSLYLFSTLLTFWRQDHLGSREIGKKKTRETTGVKKTKSTPSLDLI